MSETYLATFNEKTKDYELFKPSILNAFINKNNNDIVKNESKQLKDGGYSNNPKTIIEPEYNFKKLAGLVDMNIYHKRCCDIISKGVVGLDYDLTLEEWVEEPNIAEYDRICDFIDNLEDDLLETLYKTLYDLKALGNGAIEIIRENGELKDLKYLPTLNLKRTQDGKRFIQQIGSKKVWFVKYGKNTDEDGKICDVEYDTGDFKPFNSLSDKKKANEILYITEHNVKSEYYGSPAIVGSIPTIQNDISCIEYNTSFFKNYGVPAFLLTVVGDYEEEPRLIDGEFNPNYSEEATVKYQIEKQFKEIVKNPHSAMVLLLPTVKGGSDDKIEVKIEKLGTMQEEGSFIVYRQEARNEVINAHGIPAYMLGIQETGTLGGTNIEVATQNYKQEVILPLRSKIEKIINKLLENELEMPNYAFKILESDNRDYLKEIELLTKLFNIGAITPAQIVDNIGKRFNINYESIKDNEYLNKHYINGVPIDVVNEASDIDDLINNNQETTLIDSMLGGIIDEDKPRGLKTKLQSIIKD